MDKVIEQKQNKNLIFHENVEGLRIEQQYGAHMTVSTYIDKGKLPEVVSYMQSLLLATPATSWEEVEKKVKDAAEQYRVREYYQDWNTNSYSLFEAFVEGAKYLSQHWPSSQPVSPTPMAETWEGVLNDIDQRVKEKVSDLQAGAERYTKRLELKVGMLEDYIRLNHAAPSLHQVDRWVRVEDGLPENDDFVLICGQFPDGVDVFGQTHYYSHGHWYDDNSGEELTRIKVTHWQPLPAAPETDKKEAE